MKTIAESEIGGNYQPSIIDVDENGVPLDFVQKHLKTTEPNPQMPVVDEEELTLEEYARQA